MCFGILKVNLLHGSCKTESGGKSIHRVTRVVVESARAIWQPAQWFLKHIIHQCSGDTFLEGNALFVSYCGPHSIGFIGREILEHRVGDLCDFRARSLVHVKLPNGDASRVMSTWFTNEKERSGAVHQERHAQRVRHLDVHLAPNVVFHVVRPKVTGVKTEDIKNVIANRWGPYNVKVWRHHSEFVPVMWTWVIYLQRTLDPVLLG